MIKFSTPIRISKTAVIALALASSSPAAPVAAQPHYEQLRIIAPAAPGGGWDQTARVMQQVLQRTGIVRTVPVENISGAAGTIGLARFVSAERGNGNALMLTGLVMLGGIVTHHSPVTLADVTPIARLVGEYEVVVVPAASPFRSLDELIQAFKKRPESISWGGGSAGGTDQILAGLIADVVGVRPRRVNYIAFSGGGESLSAILGGQVSAGINGLAEFEAQITAGALRPLAISSAERLPGVNAPTLREQGVDVVLENWRSVAAPPGISAGDRVRLEAAMAAMARTREWQEALGRYRWLDRYLSGEEFARFVRTEEARVVSILRKLGTGGDSESRPEVGTYPVFVLFGLLITAIAAVFETFRASRGAAAHPIPPGWRKVALIAAGIVLDLALIERAGFVIASAALFWFAARAFDDGRPVRDAVFAVVLSTGSYVLFVRVLKLSLPAGILAGWI
jgi:putative tricarboxylic transport membrane protein